MNVQAALGLCRRKIAEFSPSASLDSQLLMTDALRKEKTWVLSHPAHELTEVEEMRLLKALARYEGGEALPYILGEWEFYGRSFLLTQDVLIPRPETELLVEGALEFIHGRGGAADAIDIGSGSGCIGITLLCEAPSLTLVATDISLAALTITRRNAERYHAGDRIRLVQADLLSPFDTSVDLVCANLPYLTPEDIATGQVAHREPVRALHGGEDGLGIISRLIDQLQGKINPGGRVLLEVREGQARRVRGYTQARLSPCEVEIRPDLAGKDRLVVIDIPEQRDEYEGRPDTRSKLG
jgi:release factor glutamine methyltransferase